MFVRLAMRNLFRNLRRTLITLAAIAFGLSLIHVMIATQSGQYDDMIRVGVSSLAGHVVVQADGYQDEKDSDLVVTRASEVGARLQQEFPDATVAPRLYLGGLLMSTTSSVGAALSGVDAVAEAKVQEIDEKVREGTWLDGDEKGIVIGVKMAETLGVGLGDKVVYMGQHGGAEEVQSRLFRVKGIFRTGSAELDGFVAMVDLPAAQGVFGTPDVANAVTLHLQDPSTWKAATDRSRELFADRAELDVLSWVGALPEIYGMIQLDRVSGDVMLAILGLIVAMGVLNTLLMSVLERTREFGVLLSLGLKPRHLAGLILTEGALIGVLGSALGLGLGLALTWPLAVWGLDYTAYVGETFETGGIAISAVIKGKFNPVRSGAYTFGAVVFTTLAAVYPAVHVSRLKPVDAMHHV